MENKMVIVIDLSEKLTGYNLFEPFFYRLEKEGKLVFANNPLTVDDDGYDYIELRSSIKNILFDNQANSWDLCVIYNMDKQKSDPIKNSITSNINKIYKNVIEPLIQDYPFGKLYYISLDAIKRSYDGVPLEDGIRVAIEFDANGYIANSYPNKWSKYLLNADEIRKIDSFWESIKEELISKDGVQLSNTKKAVKRFTEDFNSIIKPKLDIISQDSDLDWYFQRFNNAQKITLATFEERIHGNANSINSIESPSLLIKDTFKREVSSYKDQIAIIIHFNMNDKESSINKQALLYRKQLELYGFIIYLATNETNMIFVSGQAINHENHWDISSVINEEMLSRMMVSYNIKLKKDLDKLGRFASNEIEYEEFSPREFNLSSEMKKPALPPTPVPSMFAKKGETKQIEDYAVKLYNRYAKGIESAGKRIRDLTATLRIQKEAETTGISKKGSVAEISAELDSLQKKVLKLQEKIALYKPKEIANISAAIKVEYNERVNIIAEEMNKRIKQSSFIKILLAIICVSFCTYPILQLIGIPNKSTLIISLLSLFIPSGIYLLCQLCISRIHKKRIVQAIEKLTKSNETAVNDLFSNDNDAANYVQNMYDLIMLKKHINICKSRIMVSTKKFNNFNYHHDNLKDSIDVSEKLIEVLCINTMTSESFNIEKMHELDGEKSMKDNPIYCPISYFELLESVNNKAIVNDQQNVEIDSKAIGFIDKFVINYNKEYRND